jgi:glycosyltransferase involved in cell wall biosynthesis
MQIAISVVICSYNREAYIIQAIDSLYQQDLDKKLYEVIVVDNNSQDNTAEKVREYIATHPDMQLSYHLEKRQGASYARNTGAALSSGQLICCMDDDAVAMPGYLQNIIRFFETHPDATGLGGRIIPRYIPAEPKWMSHYVSSLVGNFDYSPETKPFDNGRYPLESNMIVRREDFFAVKGFNTSLPGVKGTLRIGGEGKEFFYKLIERGGIIWYDPTVIVHHVVEVKKLTPEYMYRVASGIGRGEKVRMKEKGGGATFKKGIEYLFKLGASVVIGGYYLLQGRPAKSWPVIQFRIDVLKGFWEPVHLPETHS